MEADNRNLESDYDEYILWLGKLCSIETLFTDQGQLNDSSSLSKILENQLVALLATSTVIFVRAAALAATLAAVVAYPLMLADRASTALLLVFICKTFLYVVSNA